MTCQRALALLCGVLVYATSVQGITNTVVNTTYGAVQGYVNDDVVTFHSIPFATPPTGQLRFRPPLPPKPWSGVKDASSLAPMCPQFKIDGELGLGMDEDCLYLDVYTPYTTDTELLPVMFWIFGGGYSLGDGDEFGFYDGTNFVNKRNVVIVAVNYRVGPFGFLALDELRDENNGTFGNAGLQDQTLGLKWVRDNIHHFGGDPNRVTIFGESAGGFSVCWHLASPASNGLFHRAIMESGSCDTPQFFQYPDAAIAFGNTYAAAVGCPASGRYLLACLRKKSTQEVMKSVFDWFDPNWPFTNASATAPSEEHRRRLAAAMASLRLPRSLQPRYLPAIAPVMPWGPAIDGTAEGLPCTPLAAMAKGTWNAVPVIFGTNRNEGTIFVPLLPIIVKGTSLFPDDSDIKRSVAHLLNMYTNQTLVAQLADQVITMYPASAYDGDGMARVADIITHYIFTCSARRAARAASAGGSPVYLYRFSYAIHWIEELLGLGDYHSSELPFVFDNQWPPLVHAFNDDDVAMSDAFGNYWSAMAFSGTPNDITAPLHWPVYNASTDLNLELALPLSVNKGLEFEMCNQWDDIAQQLLKYGNPMQ